MRHEDLVAAEEVCDTALDDVAATTSLRGDPEPAQRSAERKNRWIQRTRAFLESDPGGCWVAEGDVGVVGVATAVVRERLWILAAYATRRGAQGRGIGKLVLDAAESYGADCDRALLASTNDPRALRRYHLSGFDLHPQFEFGGRPDRSALPVVRGLRDGAAEDRKWIDDLDRSLRGGAHGPDHALLAPGARLVVADDRTGYAYVSPGYVKVIAASRVATAQSLLWECLASSSDDVRIPNITSSNRWAIDVGMQARLSLRTQNYLAVRGMAPPAPYIHDTALL